MALVDPRIKKQAEVLVDYSLKVKKKRRNWDARKNVFHLFAISCDFDTNVFYVLNE